MAAAASEEEGAPPANLALYRKYRPATFAEVKGQDHVTGPLTQALRTGRINHAYLFSGPRGCGKTSSARILARAGARRPGRYPRDRDRRRLTRRRGRRQGPARAGRLDAGARAPQYIHRR